MSSSSPQSPPDPSEARTDTHYVELLRRLRLSSGQTYRQLARATARQGRPIPHSTIASTLARDRLPREDFLVAVVRACGCDAATVDRWLAAHRRLAQQRPVTPRPDSHEPAGVPLSVPPAGVPAEVPLAHRGKGALQLHKSAHGQSFVALVVGLSAGLLLSSTDRVPFCTDDTPPVPTPAATWQFEEQNESVAIDSSGRGQHAVIEGNATRRAIGGGHALELDGTAYITTQNPVARPELGFTITVWVRLNTTDTRGPVISMQDGAHDAVLLSFAPATGRWELTYRERTSGAATLSSVLPAGPGRWTHLGAVYDVQARQARLYVNGDLSTSRSPAVVAPAAGPWKVGRATLAEEPADTLHGAVDDVRIFDRALTGRQLESIRRDRS